MKYSPTNTYGEGLPTINGKNVTYITDLIQSAYFVGYRFWWDALYLSTRIGLGNVKMKTSAEDYSSDRLFFDLQCGYSIQVTQYLGAGLNLGYSGTDDQVSDFSNSHLYAGLTASLHITKTFEWISTVTHKEQVVQPESYIPARDLISPSITIETPNLNSKDIVRTSEMFIAVKGRVYDSKGVETISVNGKRLGIIEDGLFEMNVRLTLGRNDIVIDALDINGNRSSKKFIVMREDYNQESDFTDVDTPIDNKNESNNSIGVVIGIGEYQNLPKVSFAFDDAEIFREYLRKTFGVKAENIYWRANQKATKTEFDKLFTGDGWLSKHV